MGIELDVDDVVAGHSKAERELKELRSALRGSRSMLKESAKQFRLLNNDGFAAMCENHIKVADDLIGT